jgi:hypothetical protein
MFLVTNYKGAFKMPNVIYIKEAKTQKQREFEKRRDRMLKNAQLLADAGREETAKEMIRDFHRSQK